MAGKRDHTGDFESGRRRGLFRAGVTFALSAILLASVAAPSGATTIGQLAPVTAPNGPLGIGGETIDYLSPGATSGAAYVVPAYAVKIDSWSMRTNTDPVAEVTFKVFRKVAEPTTYRVVAHDGPRALPPVANGVATFPVDIAVQPGDVIGVNPEVGSPGGPPSLFEVTGSPYLFLDGSLADGADDIFTVDGNHRVNVTAEAKPSNAFTLGKPKVNRKKGTARLTATLPGPGTVGLSGKQVRGIAAGSGVTAPGRVKLKVRAKGKARKVLLEEGKVKVKAKITFTPTGGDANTLTKKVKLRKN